MKQKPDTKGHILHDSTCVRLIQTESRFEILRGWGKREEGSYCLMIKEFLSCDHLFLVLWLEKADFSWGDFLSVTVDVSGFSFRLRYL